MADIVGTGKGYEMTKTGLVFARTLSDDEWLGLGERLHGIANAAAWGIGDWLVAGEGRSAIGNVYERAQLVTGRSFETLSQYARVSRAFHHVDRDQTIPWSLYREALRLPVEERRNALGVAAEQRWGRRGMQAFIATRSGEDLTAVNPRNVASRQERGQAGWRGRANGVAPKRIVRCPHCTRTFEVRRKGVTESSVEAVALVKAVANG